MKTLTKEQYLAQEKVEKDIWLKKEQEYKQAINWAKRADAHGVKNGTQETPHKHLKQIMRHYALNDLFFLCTRILNMKFFYSVEKTWWLYMRCKEVQESPNGHLDVWAREHFKTTIITFAKTIQDVLADPEITIGIFSFNRPMAKKILTQIKQELESNETLKWLFPDVLWEDPRRQSIKHGFKWSENDGIVVKRKNNPREATIEAHGMVGGQPTGRHFKLRIYDDVITLDSVTSPEMIKSVTEAWEMSINLGMDGGWERYIGTFYHYADTYRTMLDRGAVKPRIYPCFHNGREDGINVLQSQDYLMKKRLGMGEATFAAQMLCDPKAQGSMGFKEEWLQYWNGNSWNNMNVYIFVDPAGKKTKSSDYTTMWVIGLGSDHNFYMLDMVWDKLSLTERAEKLFFLHRKYRPKRVYYEEYGLQADIEHMRFCMDLQNYRFHIDKIGGRVKKEHRIEALVPIFEQGRLFLLDHLYYVNYQKETLDLTKEFMEKEFLTFPFVKHDDMLDALARITDEAVELSWPEEQFFGDPFFEHFQDQYDDEDDILRHGL